MKTQPAKVLVIDDHPFSRMAAVDMLRLDDYNVIETDGSTNILEEVLNSQPDLILLDICMPGISGFDVCQEIKNNQQTQLIPVILMTVADEQTYRRKSREVGAEGFLMKPLDRIDLLTKVELLIERKQLTEWLEQIEQVLFLISQAVKERYSNRGQSGFTLEELAKDFGQYLQLSDAEINDLIFAARLHDIGTVAIPEEVLLKKEQLTAEDRELIKRHVFIGEKICQPLAAHRQVPQIIRHHHERWDGSGYPDGLVAEQIPRLAQIFQILDIYDAVTSTRHYKEAITSKEAIKILIEEAAKGWRNPQLVQQFTAFIHGKK